MRVICDGLDLSDAVATVLRATANKTTNPILEGVKLKAFEDYLELSATDLELSIVKKIKAEVHEPGETVVPGSFFSNYLRKLTSEQIVLELTDSNLIRISYTDSEGYVQCYKADEFPTFKEIETEKYFEIRQKDLKDIINKTIFAVALNDNRPILKGVLFEVNGDKLTSVALDGYRMAKCDKKLIGNYEPFSIIIPSRSLSEISKLVNDTDDVVKVILQKNFLMIKLDGVEILTRLIEGEFINYKHLIPNEFATTAVINHIQFENTLERASLLARVDKNNIVKFDVKENNILITSNSEIGNIKENIPVNLTGADIVVAFNSRYFMDILKTLQDDFIKINLNSPYSPCAVTPVEGDEYFYLVLPVKLA